MAKKAVKLAHCATVTFKGAADWSPAGRKRIAKWLAQVGKRLKKDGDNFAKKTRHRYWTY